MVRLRCWLLFEFQITRGTQKPAHAGFLLSVKLTRSTPAPHNPQLGR